MAKKLREIVRNSRGFTLIELMVVVIIIGILAAIAVPQFMGQTDKAKIAKAKADIKTIGSAIELYYAEHENLPGTTTASSGNYTTINKSDIEGYLKDVPKDPWNEDYEYTTNTQNPPTWTLKTRSPHGNPAENIYYPPSP